LAALMEEVVTLAVDSGCDGGSDGGVVLVMVRCLMIEVEAVLPAYYCAPSTICD
jgi:hypothetical protein